MGGASSSFFGRFDAVELQLASRFRRIGRLRSQAKSKAQTVMTSLAVYHA